MKTIHVTSLGTFNACPYKFKFDKTEPEVKNLFPGDILNISVISKGDYMPWVNYLVKNFNGDFKDMEMIKKAYEAARKMMEEIEAKYPECRQETKFYYKHSEDTLIVGTPDLIYKDENGGMVIADWKTSANFSRYKGDPIREESLQPTIYSKFVMEYFGVEKVKFKYIVFSKATGECQEFERDFTKEQVDTQLNKVLMAYETAETFDEWKPTSCRMCGFCPLKKNGCPMFDRSITSN